ncbi:MAG: hypothetical protein ACRCX2_37025 [Paraclostridium sp.]
MTITKNPIFLQSCMIVYSWFQSKIKDTDGAKIYSMLEIAESDRAIVENIDKDVRDKNRYKNVETRINRVKGVLNENN